MNADQTLRATSDHGLSSLQAEAKRIGERLRLVNLKGFEIADPDAEILRRRRAWLQKRRARWNQLSSRRERAAIRQLPLREQLKHLVNIVEAVDRHGLPEAFDHWIPKTPGQHLRIRGQRINLARAGWLLHRGRIPAGFRPMSGCGERSCVQPEHLELRSI